MYIRLLLPIAFILLECSLCIKHVAGYFIHIDAHAEECFFDRVTSGTKMSLMFEVAEGGFLDIDVKVSSSASINGTVVVVVLLMLSKTNTVPAW